MRCAGRPAGFIGSDREGPAGNPTIPRCHLPSVVKQTPRLAVMTRTRSPGRPRRRRAGKSIEVGIIPSGCFRHRLCCAVCWPGRPAGTKVIDGAGWNETRRFTPASRRQGKTGCGWFAQVVALRRHHRRLPKALGWIAEAPKAKTQLDDAKLDGRHPCFRQQDQLEVAVRLAAARTHPRTRMSNTSLGMAGATGLTSSGIRSSSSEVRDVAMHMPGPGTISCVATAPVRGV